MYDIEKWGCAHCFAAVYDPTPEEDVRGICNDCHLRAAVERAVQEWCDFEDQHADALSQD